MENTNCRGCGARLVSNPCIYCGRIADKLDKIIPDPAKDPKRRVDLRKTNE